MAKDSSVTIVDIAKELKISASTVSRALNDHPNISLETKDKVNRVAKKLGYRKNILAAALRKRKSQIIGLIVPKISMYFHSVSTNAIQNVIHDAGYNVIICQSNESVRLEKELVNTLFDVKVEGLIASATMFTTDFSPFNIFPENKLPLVFFDRVPRSFPTRILRGDDYHGGFKVAEKLIEKGCRDIAFINGLITCNLYQDRLRGFTDALKKAGMEMRENRYFSQLLNKENARKICFKIFEKKPFPDAVFCANDTTAIEVHRYVREIGLKIPQDIKIVGYSNQPSSEIISPSITTVEQYPDKMGALAAEAMISCLKEGSGFIFRQQETMIPTKLILRESI